MLLYELRESRMLDFPFDEDLVDYLVMRTDGDYLRGNVAAERTGVRPNVLFDQLDYAFGNGMASGIYLVSACAAVNDDPSTRYAILAYEDDFPDWLESYVAECVPIFLVPQEETSFDISSWFRANMGSGYCLIDLDYIVAIDDVLFLIEEKATSFYTPTYGQKKGYQEAMCDVFDCGVVVVFAFLNSDDYMRMYSDLSLKKLDVSSSEELIDKMSSFAYER